jgi:hypothetical protein
VRGARYVLGCVFFVLAEPERRGLKVLILWASVIDKDMNT